MRLAFLLLMILSVSSSSWGNDRLQALPDNTALSLGSYVTSCRARIGQVGTGYENCGAITDMGGMGYDPYNRKAYLFGGGHASTMRDDVDVFDFESLTWKEAYKPTPCNAMKLPDNYDTIKGAWKSSGLPVARHTYDGLIMVPTPRPTLVMMYPQIILQGINCARAVPPQSTYQEGAIARFDPKEATWSFDTDAVLPGGNTQYTRPRLAAFEYDPPSRRIVGVNAYGMWSYDIDTRIMAKHLDYNTAEMSYAQNLVYNPEDRKHYYVQNNGTVWALTLDRNDWGKSILQKLPVSGTKPAASETGWAWDATNSVIGGGVTKGAFYAFDPKTRTWSSTIMQTTGGTITSVIYHALVYDPIDNVYLFLDQDPNNGQARITWVYRYKKARELLQVPQPTVTLE